MSDLTFEALRGEVEALSPPTGEARSMRWLAPTLAVARSASGDYEIFLRGPELNAASALVRRHLQHGEWRPELGGAPFFASRIVLPSAPHFASVATLIAVELMRSGLGAGAAPQVAFSDVEPIIEMAIRRGALPENVVIGLVGELMVLRHCLLRIEPKPELRGAVIEGWRGWTQGGRDFTFGSSSIEVKTTQSESSIHEFSGLHQLEEALLPSGEREALHILSMGLASSTVMGESLPALVGQLLRMLGEDAQSAPLRATLLGQIESYGTASGTGYRHSTMNDWSAYATRYTPTFQPRLYRIGDPAMRLLRREDVTATFAIPASLSFTLHLPERVSAFNPAPSWQDELSGMLEDLHS